MAAMRLEVSTPPIGRPAQHDRSWPSTLGLLVASWAALCGVVVGVGWLLTHPLTGSVGRVDDDLAQWLAGHRTPMLSDLADVGTLLGNTVTGQVALVAVALGFSLWQRSVLPGLFVALVEAGLLGIYLVATYLDPRPRPPVKILDPGLVPSHSFPSGHVATATAIFGSVVVLTWVYARVARHWVVPLLVLPLGTMLARMYQGAHHLSDVLTSLVYANVWLCAVTVLLLLGRSPSPEPDVPAVRAGRC